MNYAFHYIKDNGISTFKDYTYSGIEEDCKDRKNTSGIKLIGFKNVVKNEEALKEAVGKVESTDYQFNKSAKIIFLREAPLKLPLAYVHFNQSKRVLAIFISRNLISG